MHGWAEGWGTGMETLQMEMGEAVRMQVGDGFGIDRLWFHMYDTPALQSVETGRGRQTPQ